MAQNHQKIRCSVKSCLHNDDSKNCMLTSIRIGDMPGCKANCPEESMCCSYEKCF